jgi:hypothetical protein
MTGGSKISFGNLLILDLLMKVSDSSEVRRSAEASLLIVGVLMNPSNPEAGEYRGSSGPRQEKSRQALRPNSSKFFDRASGSSTCV